MKLFSSFFAQIRTCLKTYLKNRPFTIGIVIGLSVVFCIGIYYAIRRGHTSQTKITTRLYGEEIGRNGLRYKHGAHIYNPTTGKILVDSINWLHVPSGDTIGILAKNNRRAFINLNTAELITPLAYDKAWQFACNRGVMSRNDSLFIFRRDGSQVTTVGIATRHQYEYLFYDNRLVLSVDEDHVGLIDTAGTWILKPIYSAIETAYQQRLYNTKLGNECIVYDFNLQPILRGAYKDIAVDWSEGLIATEHNGIQHLFDYAGNLMYQVIYKRIEPLEYNTGRKDEIDNYIYAETDCYIYVDYNGKRGLMDKHYHILTPPLFNDIEAQTKHVFFATFGEYDSHFGTLIDDHGKALR